MRSSKSRSRKSNRNNNNRQVGNIVNRVFDSSGPEGKVRGTPQQIIDKYNQLARDAQLSGDRVAVENFQQHAEHYMRMLSEALREQAERQAQQQQNQPNHNQNNNQNNNQSNQNQPNQNQPNQNAPQQNSNQDRQNDQPRNQRRNDRGGAPAPEQKTDAPVQAKAEEPKAEDVIDVAAGSDAGLVETPENKPQKPKRTRKKAPVAEVEAPAEAAPVETAPPDAAE